MSTRVLLILLSIAAVLAVSASAAAGDDKREKKHKNKYQNIEVSRFEVKEGIDLPADYRSGLMDDLVSHLQGTKKFKQVLREGESASELMLRASSWLAP